MRKLLTQIGLVAVLSTCCAPALFGETWRFLNIADWHAAEKYVRQEQNPDWLSARIAQDVADVKGIQELFGGELIVLPGDTNGGHWDRPPFRKGFSPELSEEETVLKAGHLCYTGMIRSFNEGGYTRMLLAVGDHEIGDNPWPPGSAKSRLQPQFRKAIADAWNRNPDGGGFLYDEPIGRAPSRPVGTPYEETSYAWQYKNVLFVTLDVFHQEDPGKRLGEEGSVTGAVTGNHLEWLDQVLGEARRIPSIRHIVVQSHLPVIWPVRKVSSSGMLMDGGAESELWQTLRRHRVDLYLAGEVHDNTVTKDPQSDLVQVVSRGNFFHNIMTVDVSDDRLELSSFRQTGENPSDKQYEPYGRLVIDKSGDNVQFAAEGSLAFIDPSGLQIHFPFEQELALEELVINSFEPDVKHTADQTVRGVLCGRAYRNEGGFGETYSAIASVRGQVDGPSGKAVLMDETSRLAVWAMGPLHGGRAVSYGLWIKTTASGNQMLINTASMWGASGGFLNLNLNEGLPEVMIAPGVSLQAEGERLNDGQWHHIAMVMPQADCLLSEVRLYADGALLKAGLRGQNRKIDVTQSNRISIGGLGYSRKEYESLPVKAFSGALDEVKIWTGSLTHDEIRQAAGL